MAVAPLDNLEQCITTARSRVNDVIASTGGDILTDNNAFTIIYINNGWRIFQEFLVNYGVAWLKAEAVLSAVPAVTTTDAGIPVYINWANYFDGTNPQLAPVLPQNLLTPLALWERATAASPNAAPFQPMDRADNGLPGTPKQIFNRIWEWRGGAIYLPGATIPTDIRLRFAAFYPDFVPNATVPFMTQGIPILRASSPLAWFVASEFAKARGDLDAAAFDAEGQRSAKFIFDLEPMQARGILKESEYAKMVDGYSATMGPTGPRGNQAK